MDGITVLSYIFTSHYRGLNLMYDEGKILFRMLNQKFLRFISITPRWMEMENG